MVAMTMCIRCGKERIFDKTWSESSGTSKYTYTQTVCPDPACQKQVEELLQNRQDVQTLRTEESLKRRKENREKGVIDRRAKLDAENKKTGKKTASHS